MIIKNARFWHHDARIDTDLMSMQAEYATEEQDDTRFNDNTRAAAAGALPVMAVGYEGFWNGGDAAVEGALFDDVGGARVVSVAPNAGAAGAVAYFSRFLSTQFAPGSPVGEQFTFAGNAVGRGDPLVRGNVLHQATETATGNGAGQNLGAVSSSQFVYAALHVTNSDGDASQTLDVTIESDASDSWSGAETTRVTFDQVTTSTTAFWATPVAGAITDTWWRATYTIGGTGSPSFTFAVLMGIL